MPTQSEHRIKTIKLRLGTLEPTALSVEDNSDEHIGHAGAASGLGHFTITIASNQFDSLKKIEQHRLIYKALGDLMKTDIHALSINIIEDNI